VSTTAADLRIRGLRASKPVVDPWVAHGSLVEDERRPDGRMERALTVFLAGAECPFTCSFCDLWRWTIDGPTPPGAIPKQVADVLHTLDHTSDRIKLYNASNFFDRRAVPVEDLPAIAKLCEPFAAVTVESHANTIGDATLRFARSIPGRLEVAIGLETIHPHAASQINKRLDLPRFESAAAFLAANGIDLRVFVLLGAPHVPPAESVEWAVRTADYAARHGAAVVSVIPVRGGNGEMERLQQDGLFTPPTLSQLESALDRCIGTAPTVFTADLWDVERLSACAQCRDDRVARLRRLNTIGTPEATVMCLACHAR
jgi:radical SAM enzyme (TIGR01210 family)